MPNYWKISGSCQDKKNNVSFQSVFVPICICMKKWAKSDESTFLGENDQRDFSFPHLSLKKRFLQHSKHFNFFQNSLANGSWQIYNWISVLTHELILRWYDREISLMGVKLKRRRLLKKPGMNILGENALERRHNITPSLKLSSGNQGGRYKGQFGLCSTWTRPQIWFTYFNDFIFLFIISIVEL